MTDLIKCYNDIPVGKENAITYPELCDLWNCSARKVRSILHDLSYFDNGDNYILIRSSTGKGFYKTDDMSEIERYKREIYNRARRTFAPAKKIRRLEKERGGETWQKRKDFIG